MLLLFDIDGTLLGAAAAAHRDALHAALLEVHGVDAAALERPLAPAGRTDGEISRALLLQAGVSALRIDERADDVRAVCCREYAKLCPPSLADRVLPGVAELLEWLSTRDDVRLSLVTGNYEPVARLKLARAGTRPSLPARAGRLRLRRRGSRRAAADRAPARGLRRRLVSARSDDRDRRHAARHRVRARRRAAVLRGRDRTVRGRAARRCGPGRRVTATSCSR